MVDNITNLPGDDRLDAVFHALSNKTRRQLLADLAAHPARVNELARPYDMSVNAISKHLFVLERAGLIKRRDVGKGQICELEAGALDEVNAWLAHHSMFWNSRLETLSTLLEKCEDGDGK